MSRTLKIKNTDWEIRLSGSSEEHENFELKRSGGQNFHATMVDATFKKENGEIGTFRQPLFFEHDQNKEKVGDVVIQLRKNPDNKRFMVQVETEDVYIDEATTKKIWRAVRSSVDNVMQAVKKTVAHSGWIYSNPRRIGGKPIKTHYVITGWSPQLADQMMDIYDFVQSLDSMGLATLIKALQHMPDKPATQLFKQMRIPPNGENSYKS